MERRAPASGSEQFHFRPKPQLWAGVRRAALAGRERRACRPVFGSRATGHIPRVPIPARRSRSSALARAAVSTWLHHCVLVARLRQSAASLTPRVSGFRTWKGAHARDDVQRVTEGRSPAPYTRPSPEVTSWAGILEPLRAPPCCFASVSFPER